MSLFKSLSNFDLKNPAYQAVLLQYVWQAYRADVGSGDVTTRLFVADVSRVIKAEIVANEPGVWAGVLEAEWLLKKVGIKITQYKKEGARFKKGTILVTIKGRADKILAAERTLLNLLQRLSGVATATFNLASKLPKNIKLLATRKTFWGILDKRAVTVGGGGTHRLGLDDAILIKDNHLMLVDDFEKQFKKVLRQGGRVRFVEVEFDTLAQVRAFVARFPKKLLPKNVVVMLDNFTPAQVHQGVKILKPTGVLIEVSGGINAKNIKSYAISGVNFISSGSITNKAPALDLSLQFKL